MASALELLTLAKDSARPTVSASTATGGSTVTGTSYANLSSSFTIAAYDAAAGTAYRLTAWGHGTQGSTAQSLSFQFSQGSTARGSLPSSFAPASSGFSWRVQGEIMVVTAGSSGTFVAALSGVTGIGTTNVPVAGETQSTALNTTASWTVALQAAWGSATGSPTVTCDGAYLERLGR